MCALLYLRRPHRSHVPVLAVLWLMGAVLPVQAQSRSASDQTSGKAWTALDVRVALRYAPLPDHSSQRAGTLPPATSLRPLPTTHETARRDTSFSQRPHDPWLAFDKVQHFTFSFLWVLGSQYTFVNKGNWSEQQALPLSIGSSAAVGVAKELYDWRVKPSRYFSRRDLAADGLGILLAVGFILL